MVKPFFIRNNDNRPCFLGDTAKRKNLEAVIAVNMDTRTPMIKTRAKPFMTEVELK